MPEIIVISRAQLTGALPHLGEPELSEAWRNLEEATAGQPRTGPEMFAEARRLLASPGIPAAAVARAQVWATLATAAVYALTAAPTMPVHDAMGWVDLLLTPCPHGEDEHDHDPGPIEQNGAGHEH